MRISFLFPGQGSQAVGMGRLLNEQSNEAREVFEEVNDALGQNLTRIMFDGAPEELNKTENTQPALMAVSMALWKVLAPELGETQSQAVYAGHSLGEYSALGAIEALDVTTLAQLLRARGQAMQQAVPLGVGAMAALIGEGGIEAAENLCKSCAEGEILEVANDNSEQQVVISGHKGAIERAVSHATDHHFKRAIPLAVSAPFHCSLMMPAQEEMALRLLNTTFPEKLAAITYPNTTATPNTNGEHARQALITQISGRVRWRETMQNMYNDSVRCFVEVGSGSVLTNLAKRAFKDATCLSIQSLSDIEGFLTKLKNGELHD